VIPPPPRPEIDSVDQIVVHPCFRSPVFIRCIGALILIVALPLTFLLVDRCVEGMADSSWGHGSFAALIRKYSMTAAAISGALVIPFDLLLILGIYLSPSFYPRERSAIVYTAVFLAFGSSAAGLGILIRVY
jgi:hypothetical protein